MNDDADHTGALRSWLFVPGNRPDLMAKALAGKADAVIVDVEDAVPLAEKAQGRELAVRALAAHGHSHVYVRINALGTQFAFDDVEAIVPLAPRGLMLAKTETAFDVAMLDWLIAQHEHRSDLTPGAIEIVPLIETAQGIENVGEIAQASPRVRQLALGAGDLTLELGLRWSRDEQELHPYRARLVQVSRACYLQAPVDAAWVEIADLDGMSASARRSRDHGFQGKLCIHPAHLSAIHQAFAPSAKEIAEAHELIAAFTEAEAKGLGAISFKGKLLDAPIIAASRRVIAAGSLARD